MLRRYLVPIIAALCMLSQLGGAAANGRQIMKSNARLEVTPGSGKPNRKQTRHQVFTDLQISDIITAINDYRRSVQPGPSSNMELMEWDYNLAEMAQEWSGLCTFSHGHLENYTPYGWIGQNLYASSADGSTVVDAIDLWNSEDVDYTYSDNSCSDVCGHYTQNVWATSNRIGCAAYFCEDGAEYLSWSQADIITCNYGPGGNYVGETPYNLGTPCSECDSSLAGCEDDLCYQPCNLYCDNGGTCYVFDEEEICHCQPQWTGNTCTEVLSCEPNCENGGECYNYEGTPKCYCVYGFEGDACQIDPVCDLICENGGTCYNDIDGYEYCDCQNGWTGDLCDIEPTCSLTCQNDGSCYYDDDEGLDKCYCLDGFTGETCRRLTAYCECPEQ